VRKCTAPVHVISSDELIPAGCAGAVRGSIPVPANPVGVYCGSWSERKMVYRIRAESVPGGGAESFERNSPADALVMALELIREGMQNVQIIDEQQGSYNPYDFERLFVKRR
jgi:hypothetical protein